MIATPACGWKRRAVAEFAAHHGDRYSRMGAGSGLMRFVVDRLGFGGLLPAILAGWMLLMLLRDAALATLRFGARSDQSSTSSSAAAPVDAFVG